VWSAWRATDPDVGDAVRSMLRSIFVEPGHPEGLHGTIGSASAVHRLLGLLTV
jgi:hypothetical protein